MKAKVHQTLSHVLLANTRHCLERTNVNDALVRHTPIAAAIEHRISITQALGQIIGIENGDRGGLAQPDSPHQCNISPTNRQDAGTAPGRSADCAVLRIRAIQRYYRVIGNEGRQVRLDADRTHAGATTAVRNTEGLVQVHVRHVSTNIGRTGQTHLRIQVGAIHVNLAAVLVNNLANFANTFFVHPMGRRIGDHQAGQLLGVVFSLLPQIGYVYVALIITGDQYHAHAGHHR